MKILRRLLLLALFVGLFWVVWEFRFRNQDTMTVDLIVWETPILATWALLLITFSIGAALAASILSLRLMRSSMIARRYRKAAVGLESEIHQLRNLPLSGEESAQGPSQGGA